MNQAPLRIGVSACLLGQEVRYDGGHKRDHFVADELAGFARFVPVCPEVEVGMGVPRETLRLVTLGRRTHMVAPASGSDWTERMQAFARARVEALADDALDGYVLRKDSPSCGLERVKRYRGASGAPVRDGRGLFAAALLARFPLLPVEDDGRLADAARRDSFVERVLAYRRVRALFVPRWTVGQLARFHASEQLLLEAHAPAAWARLGRRLAAAGSRPAAAARTALADGYARGFMAALARPASPRQHARVLRRLFAAVEPSLDRGERQGLRAAITGFVRGRLPRLVPVALVRDHLRRLGRDELAEQTYLAPHPRKV